MKTIFLDIDGVLLAHPGPLEHIFEEHEVVLPGVWDKMQEWHMKGYYIVITTSRLPSMRALTIRQLERCCIPYHQLVMGINRGQRVVINDLKPNSETPTAAAYNLERNRGISDIEI